jgi:RecQ family ATP-dependent DNA helicase
MNLENEEMPVFSLGVDVERLAKLVSGEIENLPCPSSSSPFRYQKPYDLDRILKECFKFDSFRKGQKEAVESILNGISALLVLPTGSGKSLCYQMPALLLDGLTVVISPLISLMADQIKQLPLCLRGACLHSSMSPGQIHLVMQGIRLKELDIVFVAPERLLMYSFQENLNREISFVCVDEAHCLSEWSHSFRPSYLRIAEVIELMMHGNPKVLALTGTATEKTVSSVKRLLNISKVIQDTEENVLRPNLDVRVTESTQPLMDLFELMVTGEYEKFKSMIVYVAYQWQTEQVARILDQRGFGPAEPYHAGLTASDRSTVHNKFLQGAIRVVVATVAFSMGIDKQNVDAVIHLSMPRSLEGFVQETGRCARDFKMTGKCHTFISLEDFTRMRRVIYSNTFEKLKLIQLISYIVALKKSPNQPNEDEIVTSTGHAISLESKATARFLNTTVEQLESVVTLIQKKAAMDSSSCISCFLNFPRIVKLRFFRENLEDLATSDFEFFQVLLNSPYMKDGQVKPNSGVYTVDVLKAAVTLNISPSVFMRALSEHARDSFAIEKTKWSHFVYVQTNQPDFKPGILVGSLLGYVMQENDSFLTEQLHKLDCCFSVLFQAARKSTVPIIPSKSIHEQIQNYFHGASLADFLLGTDQETSERITEILKSSGGSPENIHNDWRSNELCLQQFPYVRADIISLKSEIGEEHSDITPVTVAKILHGIPSPNFTTRDWKTHRSWGAFTDIPFNLLASMISDIFSNN